jgi:hypothetical protein
MISFLKNNLSLIFNMALLVLLFTYPVANVAEAGKNEKNENNEKLGEPLKTNNRVIESAMDIHLKNTHHLIANPILKTEALFQTNNILFIRK